MNAAAPASAVLVLVVRVALAGSVLLLVVGTAAAADNGPQGSPTLRPASVESAADAFSLAPPADARCDGSGADGWRWHTFIVEAGRDVSTLEFGPTGPGRDYDATDGQITASLIASGRGVWSQPPAEQPRGLVDPGGLAGLSLVPSDYTLTDGRYLLGFACTDGAGVTRQWWSAEVTVQVAASPFLTDGPGGPSGTTTSTTSPAATATTTTETVGAAVGAGASSTTVAGGAPPGGPSAAELRAATTRVSWSRFTALTQAPGALPLGAWAALVVVLARIAYLLARPVRVRPPLAP